MNINLTDVYIKSLDQFNNKMALNRCTKTYIPKYRSSNNGTTGRTLFDQNYPNLHNISYEIYTQFVLVHSIFFKLLN